MDGPGWVALRANSDAKNELGERLFGHTSAVYFEVDGRTIFKPEAADTLVADMEDAIETIQEKSKFADDRQRDEVLEVYRQGIAALRRQLGR